MLACIQRSCVDGFISCSLLGQDKYAVIVGVAAYDSATLENLKYAEDGQGVEQNYDEAMEWYQKAAEQGYAKAEYNVGMLFDDGHGVEQNYDEAMKWYKRAAEQGYEPARKQLEKLIDN